MKIRNKKFGWDTVVIGGVEDGEEVVGAALRELKEETGYVDLEFKRILGGPVRANYFAKHKDENRIALATAVYFELKSDKRVAIAEDGENEGNEILWVDAKDFIPGKMVNSELPYWLERLKAGKDFAYSGSGALINSGKFDGTDSESAGKAITEFVGGEIKTQYKLRGWVISRQRYWGVPIPIIHCPKCGVVAAADKDLPIKLPEIKDYLPTGEGKSPFAKAEKRLKIKKLSPTRKKCPRGCLWIFILEARSTRPCTCFTRVFGIKPCLIWAYLAVQPPSWEMSRTKKEGTGELFWGPTGRRCPNQRVT